MKAKVVDGAIVVKYITFDDDMDDVIVEGAGEGEKWSVREDGRVVCTRCEPGGGPPVAPADHTQALAQAMAIIKRQEDHLKRLQAQVDGLEARKDTHHG